MRQRVTFTRSATAFSGATGRELVIEAGTWADVELGGGPITGKLCWYRLYIEGRERHGYEPYMRVDRLHRATEHAEPLYRLCDGCHGGGKTHHIRVPGFRGRLYVSEPVDCPGCSGKGHTKKYPATSQAA
ncbi:hypothetical protein [Nocardia gipuzkoensis]|uniref:hypothetical protein n=1 Tax=Nocardia gipuzkoensis TaxID=2749991 RepID=UPI00237D9021|nr:hypothetical protein [Nocardia gipuzkoensis]MDE1675193.1 hypothetical protein [Nocardia gipuzkoensis]